MKLVFQSLLAALVAVALNLTVHALTTRIDIWPRAASINPPRRIYYSRIVEDLPF